MYNFNYVPKSEYMPEKQKLIEMLKEVQDLVRDKFTFRFDFIGSSSRNMITCDVKSNKGYDFDINIEPNDDEQEYSASEIKHILMNAINKVSYTYGYKTCEDSTRVITIKTVNPIFSRIEHSCDFAIVHNYEEKGKKYQQYIRFNKDQHSYSWEFQPHGFYLDEKVKIIKRKRLWNEVLELYLCKKNTNTDPDKHSRSLYAETINEIHMKCKD